MCSNIGDDTVKGQRIRCRYFRITKTWNTLQPLKYSIVVKRVGRRNWQASTSKFTTVRERRTESLMCCRGDRSIVLKKGGVENQPITTVLGKNHFEERLTQSFIASSARLASLPTRRWTEEFLTEVRKEGLRDDAYRQAKERKENKELPKEALELHEGLLYHKGLLWIPEEAKSNGIGARHKGGRAYGAGQDNRAGSTELLVATDERTNHRLCQKLPRMSTEQGITTPTLRNVLATRITICALAVDCHGLYYRTTLVGRTQPAMGNNRSIHQDGSLRATPGKDSGGFGNNICARGMEVSRTTYGHCVRSRLTLHLGSLEGIPAVIAYSTPDVNSLPSSNGRTNGATQPNGRSVPPRICKP